MPTANMTILPARLGGVNCSPGNPQVYGNDQIKSADQVRQERANRNDWPYEHLFPPSNSVPVNQITQTPVAVPATGCYSGGACVSRPFGNALHHDCLGAEHLRRNISAWGWHLDSGQKYSGRHSGCTTNAYAGPRERAGAAWAASKLESRGTSPGLTSLSLWTWCNPNSRMLPAVPHCWFPLSLAI